MRILKKLIVATTTNLLIFVVCFSLALPAQAATLAEVQTALAELQKSYLEYQTLSKNGQVLGATVTTVNNDTELANALASVTGGETIRLNPGKYGSINIQMPYNRLQVGTIYKSGAAKSPASMVTITSADPSNRAVLESFRTDGASNYRVEGLSFRPSSSKTAATLAGKNQFIGNDISYGDSDSWTNEEWLANPGTGISVSGPDTEVAYNYLKGVNFGISVGYDGDNVNVHHNKIVNFRGDAFRGLGEYGVFEHNYAANSFAIDSNHDDMFQSWAYDPVTKSVGKGVNRGMKIRYNTFINSLSDSPLRGTAQGIGLFDGPFEDWVVENNLILVNHWHGISLYGAKNSTIQNNFVVDPNQVTPGPTWVKFFPQKNGNVYAGNKLMNNYANSVSTATSSSATTTVNGNKVVKFADYGKYFVGFENYDYTFKQGALPFAVGATIGSALAPEPKNLPRKNPSADSTTTPVTPPVNSTTTSPTPAGTSTAVLSPVVTLSVSPTSIKVGESVTLSWGSQNATTCTAGGAWTGTKSTIGTQSLSLSSAGSKTFTLSCAGVGTSRSATAYATVVEASTVSPTPTTTTAASKSVSLVGISDGATVSGIVKVEAKPVGFTKVSNVTFTIDNALVTTEKSVPYALGGDDGVNKLRGYDTSKLTNGRHSLTIVVTGDNTIVRKVITFTVQNQTATSPGIVTGTRVYTTDILNVRSTANGTKIGTQPKGVLGYKSTESSSTQNNIEWVKVDFASGVDGYVASSFLSSTLSGASSISSTQAQINDLLAQLAQLQKLLADLQAAQ